MFPMVRSCTILTVILIYVADSDNTKTKFICRINLSTVIVTVHAQSKVLCCNISNLWIPWSEELGGVEYVHFFNLFLVFHPYCS